MFGGAGVFLDGLMFGLIADEVLFLKADETTCAAFEKEGLGPISYQKGNGQTIVMGYWQIPDRLLDEPEELVSWSRTALAAARRGAVKKAKPAAKSKPATRGKRQAE